jgi:hypothetical protein
MEREMGEEMEEDGRGSSEREMGEGDGRWRGKKENCHLNKI